jgi:hypothetical protein
VKSPPGGWARDGATPSPATATTEKITHHSDRDNCSPPLASVPVPPLGVPHCGIRDRIGGSSQVTAVHVPAQRVAPMVDTSPRYIELLAEVHRLVHPVVRAVRAERGPIPGVGASAWWSSSPDARLAGLLVLAEAYLINDPERMAREKLKAMSVDLSGSRSWTAAARLPSHAELQRRRAVIQ